MFCGIDYISISSLTIDTFLLLNTIQQQNKFIWYRWLLNQDTRVFYCFSNHHPSLPKKVPFCFSAFHRQFAVVPCRIYRARKNTQWNDQNLIRFICCCNSFQILSSFEGVNPQITQTHEIKKKLQRNFYLHCRVNCVKHLGFSKSCKSFFVFIMMMS